MNPPRESPPVPAAPDRYAVAGHPVEHSRSPFIHARFAELTGEPVTYGRLPCPPDGFADTVRAFAAGGARGCNVTVPFKFEAPRLAVGLTPRAAMAQAANTLRFDAAGWQADNTDGAGLVQDITRHAGVPIAGAQLLLLGAGGAAAGVLGPLIEARPRRIVVANRTAARAAALVERHAALAQREGVELMARPLALCGTGFGIVVNATAASLSGDGAPVAHSALARGALALDMMYGPLSDAFIAWAREHGAIGRDGLGMLVEQAAESFAFWRGVRPPTEGVLAELQAVVREGAVPAPKGWA